MRPRFYLLTSLALIGLYVADHLVGIHILGLLGAKDSGLCNQFQGFSCMDVARSAYSTILGIPLAVWGEAFFLTVLSTAALGRFKEGIEGIGEALFSSTMLAVLGSIALGTVSKLYIDKLCPYCLMVYAVNIALFIVMVATLKKNTLDMLKESLFVFKHNGAFVMLGLMVVFTAGSFGLYKYRLNEAQAQQPPPNPNTPETFTVDVNEAPTYGEGKTLLQIVEFSDFECPYCGRFAETLKEVHKENPGLFTLHFRHMPMSFHQHAEGAAKAGVCAQRQGRFWQLHDVMFANRKALGPKQIEGYAKELGLDMEAFMTCLQDPAVAARVEADKAQAKALGVGGTPTFFVNGKRYAGALPKAKLEGVLNMAAAEARKAAKAKVAPKAE